VIYYITYKKLKQKGKLKMEIEKFKIKITDIYSWGEGWSAKDAKIWKDYFNNNNFIFWKYVERNDSGYLVSIHCGGMIHPMDGITVIYENEEYNKKSIEELRMIFQNLANIYGSEVIEETTKIC
jgi:hypothetical protein